MSTLPPSSGLALHFAAWEPNGLEGAGLSSGDFLTTWKNRGTLGVADASQATRANQPMWKTARSRWPAVQFDSVSDRFDIPGSNSTLKFVHETGVFDLFLTLRGGVNKYGVVIGNSFNVGDLGFLVERVHNVAGAPLTFYLFLGAGNYRAFAMSTYYVPAAPSFEPGCASKVLFRGSGVGTRLQSSSDFSTFFTTSGGGSGDVLPALPTGNATQTAQVGGIGSNYFFGGEVLDIALYNRNLSAGELTTMTTYLNERYGV